MSASLFTKSTKQTLVGVALELAETQGLESELLLRSALPSVEELEAEFGSDLVQQARDVMAIRNAHHCAAAAALDE